MTFEIMVSAALAQLESKENLPWGDLPSDRAEVLKKQVLLLSQVLRTMPAIDHYYPPMIVGEMEFPHSVAG